MECLLIHFKRIQVGTVENIPSFMAKAEMVICVNGAQERKKAIQKVIAY